MIEVEHVVSGLWDWSWSASLGRLGVVVGTGGSFGGTGALCSVLVGPKTPTPRIWSIGWGWDEECPVRPWPRLTRGKTPAGHGSTTLSWCGFLAQRFLAKPAEHWFVGRPSIH